MARAPLLLFFPWEIAWAGREYLQRQAHLPQYLANEYMAFFAKAEWRPMRSTLTKQRDQPVT